MLLGCSPQVVTSYLDRHAMDGLCKCNGLEASEEVDANEAGASLKKRR